MRNAAHISDPEKIYREIYSDSCPNQAQKKPPHRHHTGKAALIIFPAPSQTPSFTPCHKNVLTLLRQSTPVNESQQKQQQSHATTQQKPLMTYSFHRRGHKVTQRKIKSELRQNGEKGGNLNVFDPIIKVMGFRDSRSASRAGL